MKERIASLDLVRSLAIVFVVITHVSELCYGALSVEFMTSALLRTQLCAIVLHTIGRLGVPLFLFLSGYLLLDRSYSTEETLAFWKRTLPGMILSTEIWVLLYYLARCFNGISFDLGNLLLQMLFLMPAQTSHLWYMPAIISLYLFLPFISNILKSCQSKAFFIPLGIIAAYLFIPPCINVILSATGQPLLSSGLNLSFSGGIYGLLMILGWCVKKGYFNRINSFVCGLVGLSFFALTLLIQVFGYANGVMPNVWYDFGTLVIAALSLFILIVRIKDIPFAKAFTFISKSSFAVYLCHNFVLDRLVEVMPITWGTTGFLLLFITTVAISWALVGLISQSKTLRTILFNMK